LMHARLIINGGGLMLHDEFPEYGHEADAVPRCVTLHLQVDDPDEWWSRALLAGAVPIMPLADQFWGDRYGQLKDPFGHLWSIGGPIRTPAERSWAVIRRPLRSITTVHGPSPARARSSSSTVPISRPLTPTTRSPGRKPAAAA